MTPYDPRFAPYDDPTGPPPDMGGGAPPPGMGMAPPPPPPIDPDSPQLHDCLHWLQQGLSVLSEMVGGGAQYAHEPPVGPDGFSPDWSNWTEEDAARARQESDQARWAAANVQGDPFKPTPRNDGGYQGRADRYGFDEGGEMGPSTGEHMDQWGQHHAPYDDDWDDGSDYDPNKTTDIPWWVFSASQQPKPPGWAQQNRERKAAEAAAQGDVPYDDGSVKIGDWNDDPSWTADDHFRAAAEAKAQGDMSRGFHHHLRGSNMDSGAWGKDDQGNAPYANYEDYADQVPFDPDQQYPTGPDRSPNLRRGLTADVRDRDYTISRGRSTRLPEYPVKVTGQPKIGNASYADSPNLRRGGRVNVTGGTFGQPHFNVTSRPGTHIPDSGKVVSQPRRSGTLSDSSGRALLDAVAKGGFYAQYDGWEMDDAYSDGPGNTDLDYDPFQDPVRQRMMEERQRWQDSMTEIQDRWGGGSPEEYGAVEDARGALGRSPGMGHAGPDQVEQWGQNQWFNQTSAREEYPKRGGYKDFGTAVKRATHQLPGDELNGQYARYAASCDYECGGMLEQLAAIGQALQYTDYDYSHAPGSPAGDSGVTGYADDEYEASQRRMDRTVKRATDGYEQQEQKRMNDHRMQKALAERARAKPRPAADPNNSGYGHGG